MDFGGLKIRMLEEASLFKARGYELTFVALDRTIAVYRELL